jgi:hypothetical protein
LVLDAGGKTGKTGGMNEIDTTIKRLSEMVSGTPELTSEELMTIRVRLDAIGRIAVLQAVAVELDIASEAKEKERRSEKRREAKNRRLSYNGGAHAAKDRLR